jgi:hypothetical protein
MNSDQSLLDLTSRFIKIVGVSKASVAIQLFAQLANQLLPSSKDNKKAQAKQPKSKQTSEQVASASRSDKAIDRHRQLLETLECLQKQQKQRVTFDLPPPYPINAGPSTHCYKQ